MARVSLVLALALALACTGDAAGAATDGASRARAILDHVDDLFRSGSSRGQASMTVTAAHWTRTLSLEFWSKGKEQTLIRILAPQKEKGTATLRSGNDIWNYLPKVKRVIKLPSSMMSAAWMGSHFTNDDLVKESRMTEDYTFEITFEGERDGAPVIEITCLPHAAATVVWGKIVVRVRRPDQLPLRVLYYGEDLVLVRTLTYTDVRRLGGRELPATMTVVPADAPAESTVVRYEELTFDLPLDDETFSLRALQR